MTLDPGALFRVMSLIDSGVSNNGMVMDGDSFFPQCNYLCVFRGDGGGEKCTSYWESTFHSIISNRSINLNVFTMLSINKCPYFLSSLFVTQQARLMLMPSQTTAAVADKSAVIYAYAYRLLYLIIRKIALFILLYVFQVSCETI